MHSLNLDHGGDAFIIIHLSTPPKNTNASLDLRLLPILLTRVYLVHSNGLGLVVCSAARLWNGAISSIHWKSITSSEIHRKSKFWKTLQKLRRARSENVKISILPGNIGNISHRAYSENSASERSGKFEEGAKPWHMEPRTVFCAKQQLILYNIIL